MRKSTCDFNFSDVDRFFRNADSQIRSRVEAVGREAVDYAVQNGTYRDVTGNLRASNHYEVDDDGNLRLYNSAPYASEVSARGHDVIEGAALFAEARLKEIFE